MIINSAHGAGGHATAELIDKVFAAHFNNPILARMEDAAVVPGSSRIAVTTDSFVVTPLFFPGGNIGKLAVCGTVNDLAMSGAVPKYLTCGFILEEGLPIALLEKVVESMAVAAREAGVQIVAGDTKVIEGKTVVEGAEGVEGTGGLYINTTGVGFVPEEREIAGPGGLVAGDVILLSGNLGDHHAAILSARMGITNEIRSDAASLIAIPDALFAAGIHVRAMRDVTRGGLATVLDEFARASGVTIEIRETDLPVDPAVRAFCGILGLDPLYMANEGKMIAVVAGNQAEEALAVVRHLPCGGNAVIIGQVQAVGEDKVARVALRTRIGGLRAIRALSGEGLPRIC